jgi:nucleoside phosphorylase
MLEKNPYMGKGKSNFTYQGKENDRLFKASYFHTRGKACNNCDRAEEVVRGDREGSEPEIHYGLIASGDTVVKDAAFRDAIVEDVGGECICFEMEAAGLMNDFPCLVIRGISDYADSHKNDLWQKYAAAVASAYAKEFLGVIPGEVVERESKATDIMQSSR